MDKLVFLCGDVMPGRGIDQILPVPNDPVLYEGWIRDARDYIRLAERKEGPLPRRVPFAYIWGEALRILERFRPAARIVNLETAITSEGRPEPGKGIHYRMHPGNAPCLAAGGIDVAVLANNHVCDWGREGLRDTLRALASLGIRFAGAGGTQDQACAPAEVPIAGGGRILVYGIGSITAGIPPEWAARKDRPGVWLLENDPDFPAVIAASLRARKRAGDLAIASLHWGPNWGYEVETWRTELAHRLVDEAGFDLIHGHSSHHPMGIEIYRGRPILYGCGDFLNDYEGIGGYEEFRPGLTLMYLPEWDGAGRLVRLRLVPMRIRRFQSIAASPEEREWLRAMLDREGERWGTAASPGPEGTLEISRK